MGMTDLAISRARPEQFNQVMGLLADTITWLRAQGHDQWSTWRTWAGPEGKVTKAIDRGDVWLLHSGGQLVGTITVEWAGDPEFWAPAELAQPAAYLSKLAVRRDVAGNELGALLTDWAADHAYRHGCRYVRLDAWKNNPRLHTYYAERGWAHVRTVNHPHRRSGVLFQKPAQPLSAEQRMKIVEEPLPILPSWIRLPVDGAADVAGNWRPAHSHVATGLTVDYPTIGPRPAELMPFLRYRVREHPPGRWVLEGTHDGRQWEPRGMVVDTVVPLAPGATYTITHRDGDPCEMVITATPQASPGPQPEPGLVSARGVAWVLDDAPVPTDLLPTLIAIARCCDDNGRGSYQSVATIAKKTGKSSKQVQRDIQRLLTAGLIRPGDQSLLERHGVPIGRRPTVYDVALEIHGPKPTKGSKNPTGGRGIGPTHATEYIRKD